LDKGAPLINVKSTHPAPMLREPMKLQGKTALVTGGGGGIGRAIVLAMAREGADAVVSDVDIEGARRVAAEVEELGRRAIAVRADVTSSVDVERMVQEALKAFGKIDILVNNVGINVGIGMPFTNNTEEDWDANLTGNLKSTFIVCKAVAPHMMSRRSGKIVNLSSLAARVSSQTNPAYSAAKAGVITLTRILAKDLAPYNINVNAIAPGLVWTRMWEALGEKMRRADPQLAKMTSREIFELRTKQWIPLQREQTPEDIANAAVFLVSEEARNITGQTLSVDGGATMS